MGSDKHVVHGVAEDIRALTELLAREPKGPKQLEELRQWAERSLRNMSERERELWKRQAHRQE